MEWRKQYIQPNHKYLTILPHSEVCIHMRVAGKPMVIEWDGKRSVQLYSVECHGTGFNADDKFVPFSAPILLGEAGLYTDSDGVYLPVKR